MKVQIRVRAATENEMGEEADEKSVFPDVDRGCNDRMRSTNDNHERGAIHALCVVRGQLGVLRAQ